MAFKIAKKPTFSAKVEVLTPNEKCGHDQSSFTAKFSRVGSKELEELRKLPQADVMREKLVGWADLQDEAGNDVEFNNESLEALLDIPEAIYGLSMAFWGSVIKAKEKN